MASRREQIEMTPDEIRTYLANHRILIVTSNGPNGFPHPVPMYFWVDDQLRFYIATFRKTQKVMNLERNPKATLLVESGKIYHQLKSVMAYAHAEIQSEFDNTLRIMKEINAKDTRLGIPIAISEDVQRKTAEKRVIVRFTPEKIISWDHTKLGGTY